MKHLIDEIEDYVLAGYWQWVSDNYKSFFRNVDFEKYLIVPESN
jgi:hypothetical protein